MNLTAVLNSVVHRLDQLEREDERLLVEPVPAGQVALADLLEVASSSEFAEIECIVGYAGVVPVGLLVGLEWRLERQQDGTLFRAASPAELDTLRRCRSMASEPGDVGLMGVYRYWELLREIDRRVGPAVTRGVR